MSVLAKSRTSTPTLPQHPYILLGGSERLTEGPFHIITQNLMSLGSCSIDDLARSPKTDLHGFDLPGTSAEADVPPTSSQPPPNLGAASCNGKEKPSDPMQFVAQLHQTCTQTFGNSDALKFEFIEEDGPDHKQCILTITRPNGLARSYTSEPAFGRKSDAKARAAAIAVEMGAVDFILHGNKDSSKSRAKVVLAPIDSKGLKEEVKVKEEETAVDLEEDEASEQINNYCVEWRAGLVKPRWVFFSEHKSSSSFGCVLVIELTPHSKRLYSVRPRHETKSAAKKECAEAALREGIIEFIKHGNGQTEPAAAPSDPIEPVSIAREPEIDKAGRPSISLDDFFDTLPKPFPEPLGEKSPSEINAAGMLNATLQLAKGARLSLQYYFVNENGLHGCIIRLVRPEETRTYLVDPKLNRRADAKSAVCLLAMSQGISQYIRSVAATIENKITPEMRKTANELILPILGSEYAKLRRGMHPTYEFEHEQGAFGCTLVLSLSDDPKPEETRKWTVKPEYRTKTDAKIAVVCLAGRDAIEFVRFRGESAPQDHDPYKPYKRVKEPQTNDGVKKESAISPARPNPNRGASSSNLPDRPTPPLLETKEEGLARQRAERERKQKQSQYSRSSTRRDYYSPRSPGPSYIPPSPSSYVATRGSHSYHDLDAAATAVIDRITGASSSRSSEYPPDPHVSSSHASHYAHYPTSHHSPDRYDRVGDASHRPPHYFGPQSPSTYPPPHYPSSSSTPVSVTPGSVPHYAYAQAREIPGNGHPHVGGAFPQGYGQPPYSYPVHPPSPYSPPPHGYSMPPPPSVSPSGPQPPPPPPPTYSYPYAAFYADPRYGYGMTAMPLSYAVALPATPAYQYPLTAPEDPGRMSMSMSPSGPAEAGPSSASRHSASTSRRNSADPSRSASIDVSDRQKRPRSRQGTPEDAARLKKQRPDSLPSPVSIKQESPESVSPAPPTPVSEPEPPSRVEQLKEYCKTKGLPCPEFGYKKTQASDGFLFKVWAVLGKDRYELPNPFSDEQEGRQRLAIQVLQRLHSQRPQQQN